MHDVTGAARIDRPQEAVFSFMDHPEVQAVITPSLDDVSTIERLDNGGKRASYTYRLAGLPLTGEVAARTYEPHERIVFEMTGAIDGTIEWQFEPEDGATEVSYGATYDLPLGDSPLAPLVRWYNRRQLRTTLENLRTVLEATG